MTKRKRSEERGCRTVRQLRPAKEPKQHLYLLLEDWERGYGIHRLDVEAFDSDTNTGLPPKRFTEPPVARIEAPHVRSWNFISHASKIFAMKAKEASPAIPAFDTRTMSLTICPWPSCRADYVIPLLASIGGKLFLFLEDRTEYLASPPPYDSSAPWSWSTINSPLPFYNVQIACYALHPDGRTLFVSAGRRRKNRPSQAYFDAELEAWVSLARDKESSGYLCSCDVPPVDAKVTSPPSWKLGQDKIFVYMGDSKFCLIESLFHKDDQHLRRDPTEMDLGENCPPSRRRVLHMTTFGIMPRQAHACMMFKRHHDLTEPSLEPLAF
ncbi:hypothetical protein VPH35_043809 [Triticum aestivum]